MRRTCLLAVTFAACTLLGCTATNTGKSTSSTFTAEKPITDTAEVTTTEFEEVSDSNNLLLVREITESKRSYSVRYNYDDLGNLLGKDKYDQYGNYEFPLSEYEYDNHGNLIDAIERISVFNSEVNTHFHYSYYDDGKLYTKAELSPDDSERAKYIQYYDENGLCYYEEEFTNSGLKEITYSYDSNENLISKIKSNASGEVEEEYEYSYDNNGNLILETNTGKNLHSSHEYEYNDIGNLVRETNIQGSTKDITTYTYDSENRLIGAEGSQQSFLDATTSMRITYDSAGNAVRLASYDKDFVLLSWEEMEYDLFGNTTKHTYYDQDGVAQAYTEYAYDSANRVIKEKRFGGTSDDYWYEYTYDSNGNKAEFTEKSSDGDIIGRTIYEYQTLGEYLAAVAAERAKESQLDYEDQVPETYPGAYHFISRCYTEEEMIRGHINIHYYDSSTHRLIVSESHLLGPTEEERYDGPFDGAEVFFYNDKGIQIAMAKYDADGHLVWINSNN